MNKVIFLSLGILISCSLKGQNVSPDSTKQSGKVYFMRSTGFIASAHVFPVFIDDVIVCRLNNKRYSIHEIVPGTHNFSAQDAGKKVLKGTKRIEINIEPGKVYYIQLIIPFFLSSMVYCQDVTESSTKKILSKLKKEKNVNKRVSCI